MANVPIDIVPCKVNLPLSTVIAQRHGINESLIDGEFWSNLSDYVLASHNGSLLGLNLSSTISVTMPVALQPTDSLITNPFYLTLTVGSLLGNFAMLGVILLTPQFRKPANYLIVNLSFSSILFILSANLRLIENAYDIWGGYNTFRCQLLAVIHRVPIPCVALTTMVISLDRGRVARNPMNCSYSIRPAWKIISIWSFSLLIVFPLAFTRIKDECVPTAYKCAKIFLFGHSSHSVLYGVAYLLSVHIVPAAILIRESVKTQKLMKFLKLANVEHIHQQLACEVTPSYPSSLSDNRLRLLRNSCLFTTIFLVCWLPYGIFQFPLDLPRQLLPELVEIYVRFYFRFVRNFTYMQIALNPVVLFALSYDLRMYLVRVQNNWRQWVGGRYHHPNPRCINSHRTMKLVPNHEVIQPP